MAFSFYQSLNTLPARPRRGGRGFRLTAWQRFWRLEVPFAMPGLVWNMMMSMSGGWFFVVASEAITVGDNTWHAAGHRLLRRRGPRASGTSAPSFWAIVAMLVVILVYDQLLFRPLVAWAEKFRFEMTAAPTRRGPWLLDAAAPHARCCAAAGEAFGAALGFVTGLPLRAAPPHGARQPRRRKPARPATSSSGSSSPPSPPARCGDIVRFVAETLHLGRPAARGPARLPHACSASWC